MWLKVNQKNYIHVNNILTHQKKQIGKEASIFNGIDGIAKAIDYLRLTQQMSGQEDKLKVEQQKLEAIFDKANETFLNAVNSMQIKIHPVIQEVVALFYELDGIPFVHVDTETDKTDFPLVNELLKRTQYRAKVPVEYHPLLDLID